MGALHWGGCCGTPITQRGHGDSGNISLCGTSRLRRSDCRLRLRGCRGPGGQPHWLTYLAIAFGVLFAIMLFINIFLCSAMTCSCTRTEVIEKEPSIYDDYSVYESQYGYAGKQGPYSESEYGSEYGEVEPGEHGIRRPGSDYSGPDRGSRGGSRAGRYLE